MSRLFGQKSARKNSKNNSRFSNSEKRFKSSKNKSPKENLKNKKSLGQHWLRDREILDEIAFLAEVQKGDFVLEVGPGLGTLTSSLLKFSGEDGQVLAVEFDSDLAKKLPGQFPGKNLTVVNADFLDFNLLELPKNYKVCANVPYYITSKIIEKLLTSENKPSATALLIQKEVAERMVAKPGEMSILAIASQLYAKVELGIFVPREFFTPPPKVDSQVVVLHTRKQSLLEEFNQENNCQISEKEFFRVVKAGFSNKRKKIAKSLSGGLAISKERTLEILEMVGISPDVRAEDLSIRQWLELTKIFFEK